jgi:hypothetical protein
LAREQAREQAKVPAPQVPDLPGSVPDLPGSVPDLPGSVPDLPGSVPDLPGSVPDLPGSVPDLPGSVPVRALGVLAPAVLQERAVAFRPDQAAGASPRLH